FSFFSDTASTVFSTLSLHDALPIYFMRFNLGIASESLITLERECEHVKAYVEIIQARFANRMQINFNQEFKTSNTLIPPSTIQPLVENAIEHGLKKV